MFKLIRMSICAAFGAFFGLGAATAQGFIERSEGNWYVSGFVGAVFPDDSSIEGAFGVFGDSVTFSGVDFQTDVFFGGAVGGKLPFKSFDLIESRLELEVSYFNVDGELENVGTTFNQPFIMLFEEITSDVLFVQGNSYADFVWRDDQRVIPYVGGGLGVAISGDLGNATSTDFTTNVSAGATVPIGKLDLYTEGRYFEIYNDGPNFNGFTLSAGLRWNF
ncbi:MAG: hypothetical protein AAF583_12875 [Pseudomonadota bacterium]